MTQIFTLIKKDLLLEWRQKHILFGIFLYACSTVFVVYLMNGQPEPMVWNALFWLVQLFIVVNAVAKTFLGESPEVFRYYYSIVKPQSFVLAKILMAVVLQMVIALLSLFLFWLMLGNPLMNVMGFVAIVSMGALALSVTFSFLSAIAAKAGQNASLMAILGFPLVTPILLLLSRLSVNVITGAVVSNWLALLFLLLMLSGLIIVLAYILFPTLWKE